MAITKPRMSLFEVLAALDPQVHYPTMDIVDRINERRHPRSNKIKMVDGLHQLKKILDELEYSKDVDIVTTRSPEELKLRYAIRLNSMEVG